MTDIERYKIALPKAEEAAEKYEKESATADSMKSLALGRLRDLTAKAEGRTISLSEAEEYGELLRAVTEEGERALDAREAAINKRHDIEFMMKQIEAEEGND